ncbi:MAG: Uma2 family endonuclease [Acidobacteriota bacterium]|nr:Uma2 family endonuclease [Acidobacteriota bacterium]
MTLEALMENLKYPEDDFEAGLPTMDDLPSEYPEDHQLPDIVHPTQCNLLKECLLMSFEARGVTDFLIASELNIHFDKNNPHWHKQPDWFLALGTSPVFNAMKRKSYLIWQERVRPYLVLEILSKSTEKEDLGTADSKEYVPSKWVVYEDILQVPYYVLYDHHEGEMKAYRRDATGYVPLAIPRAGLWLEEIQVRLGTWKGRYQHQTSTWLRFYDRSGKLLPTQEEAKNNALAEKEQERVEKERERAEKERERAEKERERAEKERLLAILKEAGIDPDKV